MVAQGGGGVRDGCRVGGRDRIPQHGSIVSGGKCGCATNDTTLAKECIGDVSTVDKSTIRNRQGANAGVGVDIRISIRRRCPQAGHNVVAVCPRNNQQVVQHAGAQGNRRP